MFVRKTFCPKIAMAWNCWKNSVYHRILWDWGEWTNDPPDESEGMLMGVNLCQKSERIIDSRMLSVLLVHTLNRDSSCELFIYFLFININNNKSHLSHAEQVTSLMVRHSRRQPIRKKWKKKCVSQWCSRLQSNQLGPPTAVKKKKYLCEQKW